MPVDPTWSFVGLKRFGLQTSALSFLVLAGTMLMASDEQPVSVIDDLSSGVARRGSLVIIGGSERFNNREVWDEIVQLAGGPKAKIAVFPTASGDPVRKGGWAIAALNRSGADAFLVPLAWRKLPAPPHEVVQDADVVERVRNADGVFLIGGDQARIVKALHGENYEPTPLLDAIWSVYRKGGVIAGSSAGAAVMSNIMYADADSVLGTLQNGVQMGKEIDRGLGFLDHNWFVDQHCLVRGRFARAIAAMLAQKIPYGIGVDENSAVVIQGERSLRVIGYRGAMVVDLSGANQVVGNRLSLTNARLTYLDRGDRLDLKTLHVTPSPEKLDDEMMGDSCPEWQPFRKKPLFVNDILGNTTAVDLMTNLMESVHSEAIGLAFDGGRAREEAVEGFEFKFIRDEKSIGWYTEVFGGDDYTIVNIRLDIRAITIAGPLYQVIDEEVRHASK